MTIAEMHVWFRQYAQQMGMQNVRAILPEQIDLVINTSITDTVNQVINQHIGLTNDRIITDNSKIGQINALRTLYKVSEIIVDNGIFKDKNETYFKRLTVNVDDLNYDKDKYYIVSGVGEVRELGEGNYDSIGGDKLGVYYTDQTEELKALASAENINKMYMLRERFRYLYLVDLSISYKDTATGGTKISTNYFPIRLIDDIYLADTLNDFILAPRLRSPISVLYNNHLDFYIDTKENISKQGIDPHQIRISYISKPRKVRYVADLGGENVDCDLPEYMHVDILKHAVDLYNVSVRGGLYSAQQQQQNQNQEMSRNVARPDNEGYQS